MQALPDQQELLVLQGQRERRGQPVQMELMALQGRLVLPELQGRQEYRVSQVMWALPDQPELQVSQGRRDCRDQPVQME